MASWALVPPALRVRLGTRGNVAYPGPPATHGKGTALCPAQLVLKQRQQRAAKQAEPSREGGQGTGHHPQAQPASTPSPSPPSKHRAVTNRGIRSSGTAGTHPPALACPRADSSHSVRGYCGLVLEGRAFLQGTARLGTHLVPSLCPWEDAAVLVTCVRGRPLDLADLSLTGPAKFPLPAAPCPQNCSRMHWCPGCGVGAANHPKMGHSRKLQAQQCH